MNWLVRLGLKWGCWAMKFLASSASLVQDVTELEVATTLGLASSLNPSLEGDDVMFTAVVDSAVGTPTGSVQFRLDGADLGAAMPLSSGAVTQTVPNLTPGQHTVEAFYTP